jgi:hypothetical protein
MGELKSGDATPGNQANPRRKLDYLSRHGLSSFGLICSPKFCFVESCVSTVLGVNESMSELKSGGSAQPMGVPLAIFSIMHKIF